MLAGLADVERFTTHSTNAIGALWSEIPSEADGTIGEISLNSSREVVGYLGKPVGFHS